MVSYAKINIGLKIIEKTESGFHNIETIFYPIMLADDLNIRIERANKNTNSVIIHSDNKVIPVDRSNICFKVIEKFFRTFGIKDFYIITISIKKKIQAMKVFAGRKPVLLFSRKSSIKKSVKDQSAKR